MSTLVKLIDDIYQNYPNTLDEICKRITAEIVSSKVDHGFLDLIEALGDKLTSTEVANRSKGVEILSLVFYNLPKDFLSEKELNFIVDFIWDRLKDQHLVIAKVFHCIYTIVQCKNITDENIVKLIRQLFKEANVQSHLYTDRHACFLTLKYLMTNKLDVVKVLQDEIVSNFLEFCDGEKDPRNLILMFEIAPFILSNFVLGSLLETFFEIFACYFPIDFSPTTQSKDIVSREDLASSLHLVLSHTNQFSTYLVPLAMEKLDSSLIDAKMDSLKLLEMCCDRSYTPADIEQHLPTFWHALRREIFMSSNEDVEKEAFVFIVSLFRALSKDDNALERGVSIIFDECKHHISEPELRLISPTAQILDSISKSSEKSCALILSKAIPVIFNQVMDSGKSCSEKRKLLGILIMLIETSLKYPEIKLSNCINEWHQLLSTQYSFLSHSELDFVFLSLEFFARVIQSKDFNFDNRELLQSYLISLIKRIEIEDGNGRKSLIGVMEKMAQHYGKEFVDISIDKLIESKAYDIWSEIGYYTPLEEHIIPVLLKGISSDTFFSHPDLIPILDCLAKILKNGCSEKFPGQKYFIDYIGFLCKENILKVLFEAAKKIEKSDKSNEILRISQMIRTIMRSFGVDQQQCEIDYFWNKTMQETLDNNPPTVTEAIFGQLRPTIQINSVEKLMQLLLKKTYEYEFEGNDNLITHEKFNLQIVPYIRLFSNLLNKMTSEETYQQTVESIKIQSAATVVETETNIKLGSVKITFIFWLVKSLATRGYADLNPWIEKVIQLLSSRDSVDNQFAAESFGILFLDDVFSLNTESYCNIRFLYKQRLFITIIPKLVTLYKDSKSTPEISVNCIRALSSLLAHVPKAIMNMEISNIFPLLVASLRLENSSGEILVSALQTLLELFGGDNLEPYQAYFHDFTPQFLKLTTYPDNLDVRILALKCLQKCVKFPSNLVVQVKPQVVLALKVSLDDKKRIVRTEAAKTRNIWILTGAPGGD